MNVRKRFKPLAAICFVCSFSVLAWAKDDIALDQAMKMAGVETLPDVSPKTTQAEAVVDPSPTAALVTPNRTSSDDGTANLATPQEKAFVFSQSWAGVSQVRVPNDSGNAFFIKVGYSSTHLDYLNVQCRAWLTCRNGKQIGCVSTGSWCTSSDAHEKVECYAPGVQAVDRCE